MSAAVYRARVGKCPAFQSSREAVQYERGYQNFPTQPWGMPESAAMDGYRDAEEAHAVQMAAERRMEVPA